MTCVAGLARPCVIHSDAKQMKIVDAPFHIRFTLDERSDFPALERFGAMMEALALPGDKIQRAGIPIKQNVSAGRPRRAACRIFPQNVRRSADKVLAVRGLQGRACARMTTVCSAATALREKKRTSSQFFPEFPLARSSAHLGLVARAERDAAPCSSGAWGLGDAFDGAPLRAPRGRSPGRLCGESRTRNGHKSVTATFSLKTDVTVSPRIEGFQTVRFPRFSSAARPNSVTAISLRRLRRSRL